MTTDDINAVGPDPAVPENSIVLDPTGSRSGNGEVDAISAPLSPKKRVRTGSQDVEVAETSVKRVKGVAPIKAEFVSLTNILQLTC
jgi:tRNA-dihydrouridine synthase 3